MDDRIIDIVKGARVRQCRACDYAYFAAQGFRAVEAVAGAAAEVAEKIADKPKRGRPRKAELTAE